MNNERYELREIRWHVAREPGEPERLIISNPKVAAKLVRQIAVDHDDGREHFYLLFLDLKNRYLGHHHLSVGTSDTSIAMPRDIFGAALRFGAYAVLVAHIHPSGDPTASADDVRLTRALGSLGIMLGVPVVDHIIIGAGTDKWASLATAGVLEDTIRWDALRAAFPSKARRTAPKERVTTTPS